MKFSASGVHPARVLFLFVALYLLAAVPRSLPGQGTQADYDRMARLPELTRNKVFRTRLDPTWIHDERAMWYRLQVGPDQFEFQLVDLETGKKEAAFDHEKLATAIEELTGQSVDPQSLPFTRIDLDPALEQVFFKIKDQSFQLDRKNHELTRIADDKVPRAVGNAGELRPSGDSVVSVNVEFSNQRKDTVRLFWIDTQGRARGYGEIAAGESKKQHTYLDHVWLVTDRDRKPLAVLTAEVNGQKFTIDEDAKVDFEFPSFRRSRRVNREGMASAGAVSPDQKWKVEIRDFNVVLVDREADDEFRLTETGSSDEYYSGQIFWSPDSRRFVVLREKPAQQRIVHLIESAPQGQLQPKLHQMNYLKPGDQIRQQWPALFDVSGRQQVEVSRDLFENPWGVSDFRWASDSNEFFFRYNQRGHQVMRIVGIEAATGKTRAVIDDTSPTFIDYNHKFEVRYLPKSNEIIWSSERDGWHHLYLYDATTGQLKNQITRGQWLVRNIDRIDEERRQIWFQAGGIIPNQEPYYIHFCRINFDGTGLVVMTAGDGTHEISYSPQRKYLLDKYSRVDLPPVHEIREVESGRLVARLEQADDSLLRQSGWQPPERFVAPGRDGVTPIYGVIYRPTHFDPDEKYPVIEYIYAGPQGSFVPKSFATLQNSQSLAELGFIVVQIDGMGTSNRSKKFHDVCWKNLGDSGFPDRIRWLRAAARQYSFMDLSRVGIYGGSAGGQSATRALLAHGDFYHVAVSDCGCHDNRMDKIWWNEQWMGWPIDDHYEEQSNVTQAHKLQGKLLLIVGEMDRNVDPASTLQVVDALIKADKDFDFLLVPGGGHGIGSRPYGRRRTFDFFVRHLHGVEPRSR